MRRGDDDIPRDEGRDDDDVPRDDRRDDVPPDERGDETRRRERSKIDSGGGATPPSRVHFTTARPVSDRRGEPAEHDPRRDSCRLEQQDLECRSGTTTRAPRPPLAKGHPGPQVGSTVFARRTGRERPPAILYIYIYDS